MNIPVFPTDNLYKFIAIAGLALSGYCAFFVYQQVWEIKLQIIRLETDEQIILTEIKGLSKEISSLSTRMESHKDPLWQEVKDVHKRTIELENNKTRIEGKKKENVILIEQLNNHFNVFWIGIMGGLLMSIGGFWLWYFRVQKPNEELIKKRLAATTIINGENQDSI